MRLPVASGPSRAGLSADILSAYRLSAVFQGLLYQASLPDDAASPSSTSGLSQCSSGPFSSASQGRCRGASLLCFSYGQAGLTSSSIASDVADRPQDQEKKALSSQEGDSQDWHVADGEVPPSPAYVPPEASDSCARVLTSFFVWIRQATSSGWIRTSGWQRGCTWSMSGDSDW